MKLQLNLKTQTMNLSNPSFLMITVIKAILSFGGQQNLVTSDDIRVELTE